ncbi:hypothetical protein GCM10010327_49270 [Streptomyces nitrosporeus]|nr:hypothetical protein GCM10010327_49270 [Streptomyces nitrosporeus]
MLRPERRLVRTETPAWPEEPTAAGPHRIRALATLADTLGTGDRAPIPLRARPEEARRTRLP